MKADCRTRERKDAACLLLPAGVVARDGAHNRQVRGGEETRQVLAVGRGGERGNQREGEVEKAAGVGRGGEGA
jgi:hypothetical protein